MSNKNFYTVDLTCDKIDHTVHFDTEAKDFTEAIEKALKEWEVLNPVVTAVRLIEKPTAVYGNQKTAVTLSHDTWSELTTYLLMTTKYREGELEAWKELATRVDADGQPEFPNADSNARFWEGMIAKIEGIIKAIDNA